MLARLSMHGHKLSVKLGLFFVNCGCLYVKNVTFELLLLRYKKIAEELNVHSSAIFVFCKMRTVISS